VDSYSAAPFGDDAGQTRVRRVLVFLVATLALLLMCASGLPSQAEAAVAPVSIAAAGATDMVFNPHDGIIYIAAGNKIVRYDWPNRAYLPSWPVGTKLKGIDVSPDGKTVAVADDVIGVGSTVWFYLVDTATGEVRKVASGAGGSEGGTYAVAFGADSRVFFSTRYQGSGWVHIRVYDPASQAIGTVGGSVTQDTMLSASGDRSKIAFAQGNISNGPFGFINSANLGLSLSTTNVFNYEVATNATGSVIAVPTYPNGIMLGDGNLGAVGTIPCRSLSVAFHPHSDVLFASVSESSIVAAYDYRTGQLLGQLTTAQTYPWAGNHAFAPGRIKVGADGALVMVVTSGGVYVRPTGFGPVSPSISWASPTSGFLLAPDRTPIRGATISLSQIGTDAPSETLSVTTQNDGFWAAALPSAPVRMHVRASYIGADGTSDFGSAAGFFLPMISDGADIDPPNPFAPTTTISALPTGWVNQNVSFSLTATGSGGCGDISTYYGLNSPALMPYASPVTLASNGTWSVNYRSVDTSANAETTQTATIRIDKIAPATIDDHVSMYSLAATIALSASDTLSGVGATDWTLDGMPGSGTVVATSQCGTHTLEYSSTDLAGNREATRVAVFMIPIPDHTAPETTISTLPLGWVNHAVAFSLTASDTNSPTGITTYYGLNAPASLRYMAPVTVASSGVSNVSYRSTDASGNAETPKAATIRIDWVPPFTRDNHRASYVGTATISLTATDPLSGVASTDWTLDDVPGSGDAVITSQCGTHTLRYWSVDVAGNREDTRTATFNIPVPNLVAPITTMSVLPSGWVNHDVSFGLSASDLDSPASILTVYGLNGLALSPYTGSVTLSAEGVTTIRYFSTDGVNAEPAKTATVMIDKSAPVTTDDHVATYTVGAAIHLATADSVSGVANLLWALDGVPGTGALITTRALGSHTLSYVAADYGGNTGITRTVTFTVVAPTRIATKVSLSGPAKVGLRKQFVLRGAVTPSATGPVKITLFRLVHKRWRVVTSATAHASRGTFTYRCRPSLRGSWRVTAVFDGQTTESAVYGASSATRAFAVR
jgi:hypothetical protein